MLSIELNNKISGIKLVYLYSKMGIVNWRKLAQDRDGWRRVTWKVFILLDSGATEEVIPILGVIEKQTN